MPERDGSSPARFVAWLGRAAADLPAQLRLYSTRPAIDRGLREHIMLAVTDVNGCRYSAWVHGGWSDLVANRQDKREDIALAYAREAAELDRLPPSPDARAALEAAFNADEVRAIDAAIASAEVLNLAETTANDLVDRVAGARPRHPSTMAQEAAVTAAAIPLGVPLLALGAFFRQAARNMPPVEPLVLPPAGEANMGVLLLVELVRHYSGLPLIRAIAAGRLPFALGASADGIDATVRLVSGSKVELDNGLADDVRLVLVGDMPTMLEFAREPSRFVPLVNQGRLKAAPR